MENSPKTMFTPDELAKRLAVSKRTLATWRETRSGPPFLLTGRVVRYPVKMVETWMRDNMHGDTRS